MENHFSSEEQQFGPIGNHRKPNIAMALMCMMGELDWNHVWVLYLCWGQT